MEVSAIFSVGTVVQLWIPSPTGDSSDSVIFFKEMNNEEDAKNLVLNMRKLHNIPKYGLDWWESNQANPKFG